MSKIVSNYVAEPIEYREGESTLVPYIRFNLPSAPDRHIDLEKVYVGPTPRATNSMASVSNFLSRSKASPRQGTEYCRTPYRTY